MLYMKDSEKYWISDYQEVLLGRQKELNEYLLSLKLENKAVSTIIKYKRVLERFLRECPISLEELTSDVVREWLIGFSQGKSERTIDLYLSVISSFFNFCLDEEYMEKTVVKKRWRPKVPYSLPKYLDEYEYAHVKVISEQLSLRNRALVLFLFSTGCRVSEVSNLNIQDVDFGKRTANVIGKGGKFRHVYISEECALVLNSYLLTRSYTPTEPLFKNKFGTHLLEGGIRKVLKKLGKHAELEQSLHPHRCRHTFATNMLARGADLQLIGDLLGHSDLNTTRIYAQIPTEEMILKYQSIMG